MDSDRKKRVFTIAAAVLCSAIALAGTFAWQSISQEATNERYTEGSAGGRLHDDFNGENKDIYAENYLPAEENGTPVFVRIRLDEYMEIGAGAGLKEGDEGYESKRAEPLIPGADINEKSGWKTYIPGEDNDPFREYWGLETGGSKIYMPTFNRDTESLEADINGTYEGSTAGDAEHYDDYRVYSAGEELKGTVKYSGGREEEETHTAKSTRTAEVMTMSEWKRAGCMAGDYWVYDADGWAYWASALESEEATGLLLTGIEKKKTAAGDAYYAINVVAQFADTNGWGSEEEGDGFFDITKGSAPTADALMLLDQAAGRYRIQEYGGSYLAVFRNNTYREITGSGMLGEKIMCAGANGIAEPDGSGDDMEVMVFDRAVGSYGKIFAVNGDGSFLTPDENGAIGLGGGDIVWINTSDGTLIIPEVEISAAGGAAEIYTGGEVKYTAILRYRLSGGEVREVEAEDGAVLWQVSGGKSSSTAIDNGLLTAGNDEEDGALLTVSASYGGGTGTAGIRVIKYEADASLSAVEGIAAGSEDTVTIDGQEWYVLEKDGNRALLFLKSGISGKHVFGDTNIWRDSGVREYLNGEWLGTLPVIKGSAVMTEISTDDGSGSRIGSCDRVFLPSEADLYGTTGMGASGAEEQDYSFGGRRIIPDGLRGISGVSREGYYYWLRTSGKEGSVIGAQTKDGALRELSPSSSGGGGVTSVTSRPLVWVRFK